MGKIWGIASIVIACLAIGYFIHMITSGSISVVPSSPAVAITYSDLVAINLTVLGMIVAIGGIALAIAGVVGWNSIEAKAMSTAEVATKANLNDTGSSLHRIIKEAISDPGSPLHQTLKTEIQKAMFAGVQGVGADNDELHDAEEPSDQTEGTQDAK